MEFSKKFFVSIFLLVAVFVFISQMPIVKAMTDEQKQTLIAQIKAQIGALTLQVAQMQSSQPSGSANTTTSPINFDANLKKRNDRT